jgi:hypothetical protein
MKNYEYENLDQDPKLQKTRIKLADLLLAVFHLVRNRTLLGQY